MGGLRPFHDKPNMRVEALALARGGRVLFEGLSFTAKSGDYVEVRGANGTGKTSLLRALAGFLKPHSGTVDYDNIAEPLSSLHFLGHANALKPTASVGDHLRYWSGLLGGACNGDDMLKRVGLSGLADRPTRALSQGQSRRLALSRLLIASRPIWLLDEPAAGLDASGRDLVRDLIQAHNDQGGVVVAAMHGPLGPTPAHTVMLGP